jgi:hypothetical protein
MGTGAAWQREKYPETDENDDCARFHDGNLTLPTIRQTLCPDKRTAASKRLSTEPEALGFGVMGRVKVKIRDVSTG